MTDTANEHSDAIPEVVPSERIKTNRWLGYWKTTVGIARDIGELAKLVALVLAIAGLVGILLPKTKTWWEVQFYPEYWYNIGKVENGKFHPFAYQHPSWNDGPADAKVLTGLKDTVIVTLNDELHIGRASSGSQGALRSVSKAGACLMVHDVDRRKDPKLDVVHIWVGAVRITC